MIQDHETMIETLYVKYGSRLTSGVSEYLYDYLLEDGALQPFFAAVDMDSLREHMAAFLGSLTGGPDIYEGRSMGDAHAAYQISANHFQAVAAHLAKALDDAGIEAADKDIILEAVSGLAPQIINHH